MPGHHGHPAPGLAFWPAHLDVTEHPATGDLFDPEADDPIAAAQALWAEAVGMESCLFLTGGSTQGITPPWPSPPGRAARCCWTGGPTAPCSTPWPS